MWPASCIALWAPAFHLPCLISVSLLFNVCAFVSASLFIMNGGTKKQKLQSLVRDDWVGLVFDPLREARKAAWLLLAVS